MHHPLTRQPTFASVRSYWSDRSPPAPTINLHTVTKPLMRFLYHRDALAFIAKQRGTPLSNETMEIYSSYLAYKYVSSATKGAILEDLASRADSEDDAHTVADSLVLDLVEEFFASLDAEVRKRMDEILSRLARHETIVRAVVGQLVSLLRGENLGVVESATEILSRITASPEGAQVVVDAHLLLHMAKLLESPNAELTCELLTNLARHENTVRAVMEQLVSLLRGDNLTVIESTTMALYKIATSPGGTKVIIDANILEYGADLLQLPNEGVQKWTYSMIGELLEHEPSPAVSGGKLGQQVASILHALDLSVWRPAVWGPAGGHFHSPPNGRSSTLYHVCVSMVRFAQRRADRATHNLGMGPQATVDWIQAFFGDGLERETRLDLLQTIKSQALEDNCLRLMKYALPSESFSTQLHAWKGIVMSTTRYPGLRRIFLNCEDIRRVGPTRDNIIALWDRSEDRPDRDLLHLDFQSFAAACLTDEDISGILEQTVYHRWHVYETRSIIERLLATWYSQGISSFSCHVSIRYLGGILEHPSFWRQQSSVYPAVVHKILLKTAAILKDLLVDKIEVAFVPPKDSADTEGIDVFCEALLLNIQNWMVPLRPCWYRDLNEVIYLLRQPRTEDLLPKSWAQVKSDCLEAMVSTPYNLQESTAFIPLDPAESSEAIIDSSEAQFMEAFAAAGHKDSLTILLVGQSGHGKSKTINRILGQDLLEVGRSSSGQSTTKDIQRVKVPVYNGDTGVAVTLAFDDTPGEVHSDRAITSALIKFYQRHYFPQAKPSHADDSSLQCHRQTYPSVILLVASWDSIMHDAHNQPHYLTSAIGKSMYNLSLSGLVDPDCANVVVVVTKSLSSWVQFDDIESVADKKIQWNIEAGRRIGIITDLQRKVFPKLAPWRTVFVENGGGQERFPVLPNGELSHQNLFEAIRSIIENPGHGRNSLAGMHALDVLTGAEPLILESPAIQILVRKADATRELEEIIDSDRLSSLRETRIQELTHSFLGVTYDPIWGRFGHKCVLSLKPWEIKFEEHLFYQREEFIRVMDIRQEQKAIASRLRCNFEIPDVAGFDGHSFASAFPSASWSSDSELHMIQRVTARVTVLGLVPRLSEEMLSLIAQLPRWSDESKQQYHEFFSSHGTHVVLRLALGGNLRVINNYLQDVNEGTATNPKRVGISVGTSAGHSRTPRARDSTGKHFMIFVAGGEPVSSEITWALENELGSKFNWPNTDIRAKWLEALKHDPVFCPNDDYTDYEWLHALGGLTEDQESDLRLASESYLKMRHKGRVSAGSPANKNL